MKPELFERLVCPHCQTPWPSPAESGPWICPSCGYCLQFRNGIPLFSPVPETMVPFDARERGPQLGTPWRQANWVFLEQQVKKLAPSAVILDIGSGRGDFADIFQGHPSIAVEVFPYPEVDVVCDLTQVNPFYPACVDAVVLMNVIEHIYDTRSILAAAEKLIKPGGILVVAVPFSLKIHQAPFDFVRYTHFALQKLGEEFGLKLETLEGFYDPGFFIGEGLRNARFWVLPELPRPQRWLARLLLETMGGLNHLLTGLTGKGKIIHPERAKSPSPIGYHLVYRKPSQ